MAKADHTAAGIVDDVELDRLSGECVLAPDPDVIVLTGKWSTKMSN